VVKRKAVFLQTAPYIWVLLVGLVLSFPCWWLGLPQAHDSVTHVSYQTAFDEQFWQGDLYPRWLASLNRNAGSPIFYVQYPLPYLTAAVLGWTSARSVKEVDQTRILGIVASLSLIASGFTAYCWLRGVVGPNAGLFGSLVYLAAPYHLCADLYTRGALGEMFAFIWMPLCLLSVNSILRDRRYGLVGFATSYGLLIVSHLFTAILFLPILVAQILVLSRRRYDHLTRVMAGLLLACTLSAVYLGPLVWYRSLFNFHVLIGPNWLFGNHFLVIHKISFWSFINRLKEVLGPIGRQRLPLELMTLFGASVIMAAWTAAFYRFCKFGKVSGRVSGHAGLVSITIMGIAFVLTMIVRPFDQPDFNPTFIGNLSFSAVSTYALALIAAPFALSGPQRPQVWFFIGCGIASLLMMFRVSEWLWQILSPLKDIQFPWRLSAFLSLAATFVIAAAKQSIDLKKLKKVNLLLIGTVGCVWIANLIAWGIPNNLLNPARQENVEQGFDLCLPVYVLSSDPTWLVRNPGSQFIEAAPGVKISRFERSPGNVSMILNATAASSVKVNQLFFPNWRGWIDDSDLRLRVSEPEGWITFDVAEGRHAVRLKFERGPADLFGLVVTLGSLSLMMAWILKTLVTFRTDRER
jgi:hypothetical protein